MTENKRFTVCDGFDGENKHIKTIEDTVTTEIYSMDNELEANSVCIKLNELNDENEQLKSENERLQHFESLYRQKTLQLEKKYNRIIDLINEKIRETEHDLNRSVKAGMPTSAMYSEIELLEELRKEFKDE